MTLLKKVKDHIYYQNLSKDLLVAKKKSPFVQINRVAVLSTFTNASQVDNVRQWISTLTSSHTELTTVQRKFKKDTESFCDIAIAPKDLKWSGSPRLESIAMLRRDHFDLCINLDMTGDRALEYLSAAIHADLKIGFVENPMKIYDLLVEPESDELSSKLGAIQDVLSKLQ